MTNASFAIIALAIWGGAQLVILGAAAAGGDLGDRPGWFKLVSAVVEIAMVWLAIRVAF